MPGSRRFGFVALRMFLRRASLALVAFAAALHVGGAAAQDTAYPSRTVTFIVPFSPGAGADIVARVLVPGLARRWTAGAITDNRSGASGNIGAEWVARAAPDGYTVMLTATTFTSNPAVTAKTLFDPVTSFAPVVFLGTGGVSLSVHPALAADTLRRFIDLVRSQPGKYFYSSPGNGGPQHLAMELLKLEARINIVHVPYKNTAGAVTDLLAGHVQAMMLPIHTAAPYVHSGKLRMLAVMSSERSPVFPEVPTINELGLALPAIETWYAVFAPAATPQAVIAKLNGEINALLREPETREALAVQGITAAGGRPEQLGERVKKEVALWARVVKEAGIKAD